jgi:hypothetical protein
LRRDLFGLGDRALIRIVDECLSRAQERAEHGDFVEVLRERGSQRDELPGVGEHDA